MEIYSQIIQKIIKEQENIIGPVAFEQAAKVSGLQVDMNNKEVKLNGDEKEILKNLVAKYQELFGQASVEVCRDAIKGLKSKIQPNMLPSILQ